LKWVRKSAPSIWYTLYSFFLFCFCSFKVHEFLLHQMDIHLMEKHPVVTEEQEMPLSC
jgi:hypothetical protein